MSNRKPTPPRTPAVLEDPIRNRGVAFSVEEREGLGLTGRLRSAVLSFDEQVQRAYQHVGLQSTNLAKHVYLEQLHDRNETLYFKVLCDHLTELVPIIYHPTIGEAIKQHSHDYRRPRGLYLSIDRPGDIEKSFATLGLGAEDVDIIVCSDAEQILGVGDWGTGGVAYAAGTLAVYTAAAGIRPERGIAVSLDVGTDNDTLLNDPFYLGNRHARRRGKDYDAFVNRYVQTASQLFPRALLHFVGFDSEHARKILHTYGASHRVFNDDVQGTGALVMAAVYAATRVTGIPMRHQTLVVFGADAAGAGIADQVRDAIVADGATDEQARSQIWLVHEQGLVMDDMNDLRDYQRTYAKKRSDLPWAIGSGPVGLLDTIDGTATTILVATSTVDRALTEQVVQAMCKATSRPLILPISNPTPTFEATPSDIIAWSEGNALVATGVPVEYDRATFAKGQSSNNVLVYPGLGLGVIVSKASQVTPHMLQAAASALAEQIDASRPVAPLLPEAQNLRACSALVAQAVVNAAVADKVAGFNPTNLTQAVQDAMWLPAYPDLG
jgi:malate dehydrogenase (oxaloacetate-decarboxylating)